MWQKWLFFSLIMFALSWEKDIYCQNVYVFKVDGGRCYWGEYGFSFEKKIIRHRYLHNPTGYYEIDSYLENLDPKKAKMSPFKKAWQFIVNDYNKFYISNFAVYHKNFATQKEVFDGITGRFGFRRYFSKKPPFGFSVSLGASAGMFFIQNYNDYQLTINKATLIKPAILFPWLSYQWGIEKKKTIIFEIFTSLELSYPIQVQTQTPTNPWYQIQNNRNNLGVYAGLQIGYVYPRKAGGL